MAHPTLSGTKVLLVGALGIALLLLAQWARHLVSERHDRLEGVVAEIGSSWGGAQVLGAPVLTVPYLALERVKGEDGDVTRSVRRYAHFLPREVRLDVAAETEIRWRGIYRVPVYRARIRLDAVLPHPDFATLPAVDPVEVLWKQAFLGFQISDVKGIQQISSLLVGGEEHAPKPGIPVRQVLRDGLTVAIGDARAMAEGTPVALTATLQGSQGLHFLPLGEKTTVRMRAPWPSPSFSGAFLPDTRRVTDREFSAEWTVLHLNRSFPQQWSGAAHHLEDWKFGVNLHEPVNHYLKNERAVKYAMLFIGVVFLVFLGMEVVRPIQIHPVQYTLMGLAVLVFYTLLLALSEQIGFAIGYGIASSAVVGLIAAYSRSVLGSWRLAAVPGLVLMMIYLYMYMVLQLEDYALLAGAIGLFFLLASTMCVMRKVDWYALGSASASRQASARSEASEATPSGVEQPG